MFGTLDFIYLPAPEIDKAITYYVTVLGAQLIWKVRHENVVVAQVRVNDSGPGLLLASHLKGLVAILIYRVQNLQETMNALAQRGWQPDQEPFEIPHGPCVTFTDANGQRFALYQLVRPDADEHFKGRFDD